jgi:hypothetical protein
MRRKAKKIPAVVYRDVHSGAVPSMLKADHFRQQVRLRAKPEVDSHTTMKPITGSANDNQDAASRGRWTVCTEALIIPYRAEERVLSIC